MKIEAQELRIRWIWVQDAPLDERLYDGPMSRPKYRDPNYIDLLIATPGVARCREVGEWDW